MQAARAGASGAPIAIAETGCYEDAAAHMPDRTLFPYAVASPLWTDGALKRRFIALPDGAKLSLEADGSWRFPAGAVLVKEFWIADHDDDLRFAAARLVETRFLVKQDDEQWGGYSYQWNDSGTNARLLPDDSEIKRYPVTRAGEQVMHRHVFPSRADCFWCHQRERPVPLGLRTAQLNRAVGDSIRGSLGATCGAQQENQLALLMRAGVIAETPQLADPSALASLATPGDAASGTLEQRARSYLDVNCSFCHYGRAFPSMNLAFDLPLADTETCNAPSYRYDIGQILLVPGDAEASVLWRRMVSRDFLVGMPPVGTVQVHTPGADLVAQWINSLDSCPTP